jgi:hypothetical protein
MMDCGQSSADFSAATLNSARTAPRSCGLIWTRFFSNFTEKQDASSHGFSEFAEMTRMGRELAAACAELFSEFAEKPEMYAAIVSKSAETCGRMARLFSVLAEITALTRHQFSDFAENGGGRAENTAVYA